MKLLDSLYGLTVLMKKGGRAKETAIDMNAMHKKMCQQLRGSATQKGTEQGDGGGHKSDVSFGF